MSVESKIKNWGLYFVYLKKSPFKDSLFLFCFKKALGMKRKRDLGIVCLLI